MSYDYVPIIIADDWGLVGIVPHGNAGEKIKKMSLVSQEEKQPVNSEIKIPQKISEATIINTPSYDSSQRTPMNKIITKTENMDIGIKGPFSSIQITPADPIKNQHNPNSLSGLIVNDGSSSVNSSINEPYHEIVGNLSGHVMMRKENILVGLNY